MTAPPASFSAGSFSAPVASRSSSREPPFGFSPGPAAFV